jgi:glycosyltransferase involved in cell wall biosynthesis
MKRIIDNILILIHPKNLWKNIKMFMKFVLQYGLIGTIKVLKYKVTNTYNEEEAYQQWRIKTERYDEAAVLSIIHGLKRRPTISIIMPVYNVDERWLRKCIESVKTQYYDNWQLCIAEDCSTMPYIKKFLKDYAAEDERIKVVFRERNGHISKASNSALELATGEFVALLDNDDELPPFSLYEVIRAINEFPEIDMFYSDEDKIDEEGNRREPYFKPDWSPDTFRSSMYTCHLGVYRREIIEAIGGFRAGYEGGQDYDLVLRFSQKTNKIMHIPRILYHWRMIAGSTALVNSEKNYAWEAGKTALKDALNKERVTAEIAQAEGVPYYDVRYDVPDDTMVSIIIPTKDHADDLKQCIDSIYEKTQSIKFEIIVVDNGSSELKTDRLLNAYRDDHDNFSVSLKPGPFNFSRLNNQAVLQAKGNLLLFLNNDIEIITQGWLRRLAGQALQSHVGAVGAKLLYENDTVQHMGVVLGVGGVANHLYLNRERRDNGYFAGMKIVQNVSAITGACLMMRKDLFDDVGGFNEQELAVAFNDIDLCLRLLEKGYYNVIIPAVELYHYESKSRGKDDNEEKAARFQSETDYMMEKWGELLENDPFYNSNFTRDSMQYQIEMDV